MAAKRILVVEDNMTASRIIQLSLKRSGYEISGAVTSGEQAVEEALQSRPDLVIMDIMLSGTMNGIQAAAAIREKEPIPVIFLTAYEDEGILKEAQRTEPFGYLIKPFKDNDLRVNIEMALYRAEMEEKLRRSEENKAKLEEQLRQAQKMKAIGMLAGGIAHDFNNIMSIISGYTELAALEAAAESKQRSHLDHALEAVQRGKDVVRQILAFSRRDAPDKKPIDLAERLQKALTRIYATLPAGIEVRKNLQLESAAIVGNADQMDEVFVNLFTNALRAMAEHGGLLGVSLCERVLTQSELEDHPDLAPGPYAELAVTDTGHGMSKETLERVFDPYFTTMPTGGGSGLGLSVVLGIVKGHNGEIVAESIPGQGSAFRILLPLHS